MRWFHLLFSSLNEESYLHNNMLINTIVILSSILLSFHRLAYKCPPWCNGYSNTSSHCTVISFGRVQGNNNTWLLEHIYILSWDNSAGTRRYMPVPAFPFFWSSSMVLCFCVMKIKARKKIIFHYLIRHKFSKELMLYHSSTRCFLVRIW